MYSSGCTHNGWIVWSCKVVCTAGRPVNRDASIAVITKAYQAAHGSWLGAIPVLLPYGFVLTLVITNTKKTRTQPKLNQIRPWMVYLI